MTCYATAVEKLFILRCHSSYLFSALELTHCANQRVACVSLCSGVPAVVRAEPVQGAAEETDVVTNLGAVSKLQQS